MMIIQFSWYAYDNPTPAYPHIKQARTGFT